MTQAWVDEWQAHYDNKPKPALLSLMIEQMRKLDGRPMPYKWYDDPADQMLVFMGHEPRPGATYTLP